MFRYLVLGFFDHQALAVQEVALRKPLEISTIEKLIRQFGQVLPNGDIQIDGMPLLVNDGYLSCPSPVIRLSAVSFIARLVEETSCEIADVELGQILTVETLRELREILIDPKNQAPSPFE